MSSVIFVTDLTDADQDDEPRGVSPSSEPISPPSQPSTFGSPIAAKKSANSTLIAHSAMNTPRPSDRAARSVVVTAFLGQLRTHSGLRSLRFQEAVSGFGN